MEKDQTSSYDTANYYGRIITEDLNVRSIMRETEKIIQEFAERLKMTREYKLYESSREKIKDYPEFQKQIEEFRNKKYMLQKSEEDLFDKMDAFEKEFEELYANPVVAAYLEAEEAVCRMIREIYAQIASAIELDFI